MAVINTRTYVAADVATSAAVDQKNVAPSADANTIAGLQVIFEVDFADVASTSTDVVLEYQTRILDMFAIKTAGAGAAGNTIQLQTAAGANNITDAIDMNVADTTVVRTGTVDDAFATVAAGGTLRVDLVKSGGDSAAQVYIVGLRV